MTPERAKMLEVLVVDITAMIFDGYVISPEVSDTLSALDALPAEPADAGEMVEVRAAVIESPGGDLTVVGFKPNGREWNLEHNLSWRNLATITARIPRPVVPEVRAEVET